MSVLTVYDDLFLSIVFLLILLFDTFLQAKYYRTGRIDNFNIIFCKLLYKFREAHHEREAILLRCAIA